MKSPQQPGLITRTPLPPHIDLAIHPPIWARAKEVMICVVKQRNQPAFEDPRIGIVAMAALHGLCQGRITDLAVQPWPSRQALI